MSVPVNVLNREYFYARVSSKDQNLARQIDAAHEAGISDDHIFTEKASGKDVEGRPVYQHLRDAVLKPGDTLFVLSVDRLGRNYDETYEEWQSLVKAGIDIVVLDMPLLDTRQTNKNGLDGKFVADLVLKVLTYVAQKERENNRERQRQGYSAMPVVDGRKIGKTGRACGRQEIELPNLVEYTRKVAAGLMNVTDACAELGISRNTWYRKVKELGA